MATELYNTLFNHPFYATRFNIPESFGRCLSYEAQIHCLLCMIDEIVGATWVSPDELNTAVSTIEKEITELETKLETEINNLSSTVEQYHTELTNKITELNDKLEDYNTQMIERIQNVANDLSTYKTSNDNRVTKVEGDISSLSARMTTAEGDISSLTTRVTSNEGDISNLKTRMTTAEGNITSLTTRVGANETAIANLQTSVSSLIKSRDGLIADIYSASLASDGSISIASGTKIPVAALNLWSNNSAPTVSDYANALRSRDVTNGDIKGV